MAPEKEYDHEKSSFTAPDTQASNPPHPVATTIQLTPEQYERLYFQPGGPRKRVDLASIFGNPTPFCLICHLLCLTPTGCILMGWNHTTTTSLTSIIGPLYFVGGLGMFVGGILEWIVGNTFPSVVFGTFGGLWFSLGVTNDPSKLIASAFEDGESTRAFNTGIEFYFIFWAVASLIYFLSALRTNVVLAEMLFAIMWAFIFLAAGYDKAGSGNTDQAKTMFKTSGAFIFACSCGAWYLVTAALFASVDMPFEVPVGDLSHFGEKRPDIESH